jgi:putative heme-binding domain-containing protein
MGLWIKVPGFTLILVGLFAWAGEVVTRASGGGGSVVTGEGVSVETGEQVFWGAGKCHTCHSVGDRGGKIRGPNLGETASTPAIGVRAAERAREREAAAGTAMTPTGYLVESLAEPGAYVVAGYKNEMPRPYEPPISLPADQIVSVILYLQSLGGAPDASAIVLPNEVRTASRGAVVQEQWRPYLPGDSASGRALFFDLEGPAACAKCHVAGDRGGDVGPDLSAVSGTRTAQFIIESILEPSKQIASGYESSLFQLQDGRLLDGVVRRETGDSLWLATADGRLLVLAQSAIARRRPQELSLMPDNLASLLSVTQLHDLLAYLETLR